jgi:predicted DsbA family dithiol-disulfide isomerase
VPPRWEGLERLVNSRLPESTPSGEIAGGKKTPIPVRLWIDPGCPWAWQGALWLRRIAAAGRVEIDWRIFSLELNASDPSTPFWEACQRQGESLVALALARRQGGAAAFERLFLALGERLHREGRDPSGGLFREAAAHAGMSDVIDEAVRFPDLADEVRREFQDARHEDVFGVPSLGIGDAKPVYGPVLALAPEGDDAERLWEHTLWLAERPDFFELKRWPRDTRPGEAGSRPASVGTVAADVTK